MGMEQSDTGNWNRVRELADKLLSPNADRIYVAKEYTKADLRRDLLATIPTPPWANTISIKR